MMTVLQSSPSRNWKDDILSLVEYQNKDGIATLTLNDPPANTYSYEMMRELDDAILRARFDARCMC